MAINKTDIGDIAPLTHPFVYRLLNVRVRWPLVLASISWLFVLTTVDAWAKDSQLVPSIEFCGAAGEVSGSCHLIRLPQCNLLIDCGLFYGKQYDKLNRSFPFDPKTIDYVLLTHAHIDHCGRLPLLVKKGFAGTIIATAPTAELAGIMLKMSHGIGIKGDGLLYSSQDLQQCLSLFRKVEYKQPIDLATGVQAKFDNAGHILGSAIVEITFKTKGNKTKRLVASGDLGPSHSPLLPAPASAGRADFVLVESTYGGRRRKPLDLEEFAQIIRSVTKDGGSILIPAFVLGRTQKVLAVIGELKQSNKISSSLPVYVDSYTAQKITRTYKRYADYGKNGPEAEAKSGDSPLDAPGLEETTSKKSLASHDQNQPAIYISSSGMLDHGASPQHLIAMIENPRNALILVGWQSPYSVGRRLERLAEMGTSGQTIDIFTGEGKYRRKVSKKLNMAVYSFAGFSAHAGANQLIDWIRTTGNPSRVFVVHGSKYASARLAALIRETLKLPAVAPRIGDRFSLITGAALDVDNKSAAQTHTGREALQIAP